ncbi:MAG TPA: LPXTG cell wall anchor domain-containing protein [Bacillales bacterium]
MIWVFVIGLIIALGSAFLIDRRRKKIRNNPRTTIDPNNKPGDGSNYKMGDDDYFSGGG